MVNTAVTGNIRLLEHRKDPEEAFELKIFVKNRPVEPKFGR